MRRSFRFLSALMKFNYIRFSKVLMIKDSNLWQYSCIVPRCMCKDAHCNTVIPSILYLYLCKLSRIKPKDLLVTTGINSSAHSTKWTGCRRINHRFWVILTMWKFCAEENLNKKKNIKSIIITTLKFTSQKYFNQDHILYVPFT